MDEETQNIVKFPALVDTTAEAPHDEPAQKTAIDHLKDIINEAERVGGQGLVQAIVVLQFSDGAAIKGCGDMTFSESIGLLEIGKQVLFQKLARM